VFDQSGAEVIITAVMVLPGLPPINTVAEKERKIENNKMVMPKAGMCEEVPCKIQ
jgi:hypothetical protein